LQGLAGFETLSLQFYTADIAMTGCAFKNLRVFQGRLGMAEIDTEETSEALAISTPSSTERSFPIATGRSDSCRVRISPTEELRLSRRTEKSLLNPVDRSFCLRCFPMTTRGQ
jgi:hypothetical protein